MSSNFLWASYLLETLVSSVKICININHLTMLYICSLWIYVRSCWIKVKNGKNRKQTVNTSIPVKSWLRELTILLLHLEVSLGFRVFGFQDALIVCFYYTVENVSSGRRQKRLILPCSNFFTFLIKANLNIRKFQTLIKHHKGLKTNKSFCHLLRFFIPIS